MTTIPESLRGQAPAIAAVVPPLAAATNDTGRTVWCGPVALSAITGAPASEIEALIRAGRSARPVPALDKADRRRAAAKAGDPDAVVGTSADDLRTALALMGWAMATVPFEPVDADGRRLTLRRWLERPRPDAHAHYVLGIRTGRVGHWIAIKGVMMADTYTGGRWGFAVDGPHLGRRVEDVYAVVRQDGEAAR